jgi:hypothetical protein
MKFLDALDPARHFLSTDKEIFHLVRGYQIKLVYRRMVYRICRLRHTL